MFERRLSRKGNLSGSTDDCMRSHTYRINVLKMIVTKDGNKITRLMGLTIMQASKNFKSNRLLGIFGRSNGISKSFAKHLISGVERILGKCEELSVGGIHVARTAMQ